ncbi:MAG TPA: CHAD domain-containing protein [Acidimicrobiales bacterium]|nr:CHAD domain-containing protein [Acidimicrobiales bacterium]
MDATSFTSTDLGAAAVVDALVAAGFSVGSSSTVARTMLDTFDGRLHAAGLRLELHRSAGQELVLRGGGPTEARVAVAERPRLAADVPAGPLRRRLAAVLDVRALLPVLTVTARMRTAVRRDPAGKVRAGISVAERLTVESFASPPFAWVATVEPLAGYAKDAESADRLLSSMGLRRTAGGLLDAVAGALVVDVAGFRGSPTVPLDPGEPALDAFRKVLSNLAAAIDANRPGTIDHIDPEFLHDLRVAVRRTRSVLSEARGVLPPEVRRRFREGFGWLGQATGPARDLDVYVIEWADYVAPLGADAAALGPVLDDIVSRRAAAHATLAKVLQSSRYRQLLTGWHRWVDRPAVDRSAKDACRDIAKVAGARIQRAQAQVLDRGRGIDAGTPAEELHELRKDAKKLRYLLECLGGLYAPPARKAFVQRLKALQDNLGEHQDAEVHVTQLREMSRSLQSCGPDTLVAVGRLTESLEGRRRAARDEFAQRFAAYDTKRTAETLAALLRSTGGG